MARVLILKANRRVLFYSPQDTVMITSPLISKLVTDNGGASAVEMLSLTSVPSNLRLGLYLDELNTQAARTPFGDAGEQLQRKARLTAKLDEHQSAIRGGALAGIPSDLAMRWYKYLRMMVQASLRENVFTDAEQWALVEVSLDVDPYDLEGMTTEQATLFDETFADDGEFALGWFDIDAKAQTVRTDVTGDRRLSSGVNYDYRFASKVRLIPESEIDRRNTLLFSPSQNWQGRGAVVDRVNERFPWYISKKDSLLSNARFTPRLWPNFLPDAFVRSGNFASTISAAVLVVHTRSHSATTRIVAGTFSSTTGSLNVPFALGQVVDFVVTVTAGDGVTTSTYTYTVTRRAVN